VIVEHYYTGAGRQRAVFLGSKFERGHFALELKDGDEAELDVSYEPETEVRKGRAAWQPYAGGLGGSVDGMTAMRVNIKRVDGWVKLTLRRDDHGA